MKTWSAGLKLISMGKRDLGGFDTLVRVRIHARADRARITAYQQNGKRRGETSSRMAKWDAQPRCEDLLERRRSQQKKAACRFS